MIDLHQKGIPYVYFQAFERTHRDTVSLALKGDGKKIREDILFYAKLDAEG